MADSVMAAVRRNAYLDSVSLLQVSAEMLALAGVLDAALVMASDLNRQLLSDSSLLVGDAQTAGPNDLVIAVRAADETAATAALQQAELLLAGRRRAGPGGEPPSSPPRSLRSAHRADPEANLALVSVPGAYAASEARQALADGLHVFLFSDNVSIADEVDLKRFAQAKGLLMMGPDCGTAILNGIGLGFANMVRRGRIDLYQAARLAASPNARWTGVQPADLPRLRLREHQHQVRGLFCGGTLCQEAAAAMGSSGRHQFIDFGDDEYTRGRAHPMIDPTLRNRAIVEAGADPRVAVLLLDVILGLGSHADPAGASVPAIREALARAAADRRELAVLAHVVGTDLDPQGLARQEATLRSAGVHLLASNYHAGVAASLLLEGAAA
ncbi:MAG: hypothetical protein LC797_18830 [Chloroflexi bacterium]|nr:hypothetical protein [Chloroflexota bacterium]